MGLLVHSGWKETAIDYKFRLPLHQQNDAICIWQIPPGRHGLESSFWYGKWLIPHNWFLSTLLELVTLILSWDYQMVIWSPGPYRGFVCILQVIVSARKPDFFQKSNPLYEIVTEEGLMRPCFKATSGTYRSGSCEHTNQDCCMFCYIHMMSK